jgi:acetate kinase
MMLGPRKLWICFATERRNTVGAYAAVLGGLDVLIFAGGIGEHAPVVRKRICDGLDFLGIRLDAASNEVNAASISSAESPVKVRVIKTNEDLMIVRHVLCALGWTDNPKQSQDA